ncbi:MAG: iron chaperone [Longimicrobiales bacterium]
MRSKSTGPRPTTPDEYLATLGPEKRAALEKLRKTIRAAAPKAEECMSYGLPAFRHEGRFLVAYGAATNHCAFYPGGVTDEFASELEGFAFSKGAIRFQPEQPLPSAVVRKMVQYQLGRLGS